MLVYTATHLERMWTQIYDGVANNGEPVAKTCRFLFLSRIDQREKAAEK